VNSPKPNHPNDAAREQRYRGARALSVDAERAGSERVFLRAATGLVSVLLLMLTLSAAWMLVVRHDWQGALDLVEATVSSNVFWTAVAAGLFAQIVDGALGMAYGVTASTFLIAAGASPATASANVHIAEVFTTGVSGAAHARLGNVDKKLFLRLVIPGALGAVCGAVVVTQIDGAILKPFVSAYLLLLGVYILIKAIRTVRQRSRAPAHVGKLALAGGFLDAAGGGGWGPVVTSTLIGSGSDPRKTIGSVNFAEFFYRAGGGNVLSAVDGDQRLDDDCRAGHRWCDCGALCGDGVRQATGARADVAGGGVDRPAERV
jgi:uncharacterized protein